MNRRYILKNMTKRDVNLGDLRYKIPANQSRDLFAKTARLEIESIDQSKKNGSIYKYLEAGILVEVCDINEPKAPLIYVDSMPKIKFPRHLKTKLTIEIGDVDEEMKKITIDEEEDFLKELDYQDAFLESVPLVSKKDDD